MATTRVIQVVISAKDLITKTMNTVNSRIKRMSDNFVNAAAKMAVAAYALKKAWDIAFDAASFKQSEVAFANLAASHGQNSQQMIAGLKAMSAQTISTADLMKSAGTAMLLGIPADKLSNMMEIARASSRITGDSIQKSFDDISKGVGRQSKLILDNLGIMVSVDKTSYSGEAVAVLIYVVIRDFGGTGVDTCHCIVAVIVVI